MDGNGIVLLPGSVWKEYASLRYVQVITEMNGRVYYQILVTEKGKKPIKSSAYGRDRQWFVKNWRQVVDEKIIDKVLNG